MRVANPDALEIEDVFDVLQHLADIGYSGTEIKRRTKQILGKFWISPRFLKFFLFSRFRDNASELIAELKENGYSVEIHTSRASTRSGTLNRQIVQAITRLQFWLNGVTTKDMNFCFYETDADKVEGIKKAKPVTVFEDKVECIRGLSSCGIITVCIAGRHNIEVLHEKKTCVINGFDLKEIRERGILSREVEEMNIKVDELTRTQILQEINMCREDERNSQDRQLQIFSISAAVLAILFGAVFVGNNTSLDTSGYNWFFSLLCDFMFLAAFTHMTYLGIGNVLRYHYIQDLERQLRIDQQHHNISGEPFIGWMEITSPIRTQNFKHLKSMHSVMHYLSYTGSAALSVIFCLTITIALFTTVDAHKEWARIGLIVVIVISIVEMLILIIGSSNAKEMYEWSKKQANKDVTKRDQEEFERMEQEKCMTQEQTNMQEADNNRHKKEVRRAIIYYIYPKIQDMQKMILIVLGAICGIVLVSNNATSYIGIIQNGWTNFAISFVIIELLIYAARYQFNDVRGVSEDEIANKKREDENKSRRGLPRILGSRKADVKLSLVITGIKIGIAIVMLTYIMLFYEDKRWLCITLFVIFFLITIATVIYEKLRTKEKTNGIIFAVGLGYPLRFIAGVCAIYTSSAPSVSELWDKNAFIPMCCLMIALYFYGIMSATLPWIYNTSKEGENDSSKDYYRDLYKYVIYHPSTDSYKESRHFGLKHFKTPWEIAYFVSLAFMSLAILISRCDMTTLGMEIVVIILALTGCVLYDLASKIFAAFSAIIPIVVLIMSWSYWGALNKYLLIIEMLIIGTHYFLCFMVGDFDWLKFLVGKKTAMWINE